MKNYSWAKKYDVVSNKNIEEDEVRSEAINTNGNFDLSYVSQKSIHNKMKDFR